MLFITAFRGEKEKHMHGRFKWYQVSTHYNDNSFLYNFPFFVKTSFNNLLKINWVGAKPKMPRNWENYRGGG